MPKSETANSVQPHTEAKLQFYARYLARYLAILLRSPWIEKINLYDLFCGEGEYSDGNSGSALRAVDAIDQVRSKNEEKPINLHLHDLSTRKTDKLKDLLANRNLQSQRFAISFSNLEASQLLENLLKKFPKQPGAVRNLVFIDPYGYKHIDRRQLESLLEHGKTEIVLFLPIEQMYRFLGKTKDEDVDSSYKPLKKFVDQFELDTSAIKSEKDFIKLLEIALSFNKKYYATSYSIRNHTGHYYGMFFVTKNILGLEKILEVKWELDEEQGAGFSGALQKGFILEMEAQIKLEKEILQFLSLAERSNAEMYDKVLELGFLPKHLGEFLRQLCASGGLEILDSETGLPARKNSFKISYKNYKHNLRTFRLG